MSNIAPGHQVPPDRSSEIATADSIIITATGGECCLCGGPPSIAACQPDRTQDSVLFCTGCGLAALSMYYSRVRHKFVGRQ